MRWFRHDRQGWTVAAHEEIRGGWYWHVRHPQYGAKWGRAVSKKDAYLRTRWAIGDLRNGFRGWRGAA